MTAQLLTAPTARLVAGRAGRLRLALRLDAVVTGVNGAVYLAAAGPLADLLGMPAGALRGIGAFLVAFAVAVWAVSRRPRPAAVRAVVAANALWALGSVIVAAAGGWSPTTAGTAWTLVQAATVAGFALLQGAALRRA